MKRCKFQAKFRRQSIELRFVGFWLEQLDRWWVVPVTELGIVERGVGLVKANDGSGFEYDNLGG